MSNNTQTVSTGVNWLGLLGIIFVLCKVFSFGPIAAWSWWLVTLPFWIGIALILAFFIILGLIYLIACLFS
jgi:hypothetical protein